jgi:hypothetical protein
MSVFLGRSLTDEVVARLDAGVVGVPELETAGNAGLGHVADHHVDRVSTWLGPGPGLPPH